MSSTTSTYFCVLTIRKQLPEMRFERSGRGQEPSRGHKFSILEKFLSIRDFTSQTLASFLSDLVGVALVGATPLHLLSQTALPLKSPTGAFSCAAQTRSHPKPCSWFAPDGANSNGVSCFTYAKGAAPLWNPCSHRLWAMWIRRTESSHKGAPGCLRRGKGTSAEV